MVHGDDFISTGPGDSLKWMEQMLSKDFKIKTSKIGPENDEMEFRVLSRILRYTKSGIDMEADLKSLFTGSDLKMLKHYQSRPLMRSRALTMKQN